MRAQIAALGLVLAVACGADSASATSKTHAPPEVPWSGTYSLKLVNGQRLPYSPGYLTSTKYTLTGRTIYVYGGHTWSSFTRYSDKPGAAQGDTTVTETGTWTRSDPEGFVTLTLVDGITHYGGIADGDLLRLAQGGDVFDYSR